MAQKNSSGENLALSDVQADVELPHADSTVYSLQRQVTYKGAILLKNDILRYYYSPGPEGYDEEGNRKFICSSEFDGGWGTKWQLQFSFDTWIGNQRWMSLYIKHLSSSQGPWDLMMQIEFRILNTSGKVSYNKRSALQQIEKGELYGYKQFLHFLNVPKMLGPKNSLQVEVHFTMITSACSGNLSEAGIFQNHNQVSEATSEIDDNVSSDWVMRSLESFDIHVDDRVAIHLDGIFVGFVSREKLMEKSIKYQQSIELDEEIKHVLNLPYELTDDINESRRDWERKILYEFICFIQNDHSELLESGSYEDLHLLLLYADKMQTKDLLCRCLTCMFLKLTVANAAAHVAIITKYSKEIEQEDVLNYQQFFKEFSKFPPDSEDRRFQADEFVCFVF